MSKFFDPRTRKVHSIDSYAGALKISKEIVEASIKVKENKDSLVSPKLRRSNAVMGCMALPVFFSKEDHQIHTGNFNLSCASNADLIPITSTITYK